ncbi:MAG TPA: cell wall hydrolase [Alphaproteobacteria bacterium]|nr:cell wall hydrolase [Alphaproteobacteria bacterium]
MQRILAGVTVGFALLVSGPAHEAVSYQAPAYQLTHTFSGKLAGLDQQELRCLAMNVYFEARGEEPEGQLAVAHVTLNRLRDAHFPKTVCKVVYQSGAFSWTSDRSNNFSDVHEEQAWHLAMLISQMALTGLTEDPTKGAVDFHATSIHPWWVADKEFIWQLGHHKFYVRPAPGTAHASYTTVPASYTRVARTAKPNAASRKPAVQLAAQPAPVDRQDKSEQIAAFTAPKNSDSDSPLPSAREFRTNEGHG